MSRTQAPETVIIVDAGGHDAAHLRRALTAEGRDCLVYEFRDQDKQTKGCATLAPAANLPYGPVRRGRGGKVRKW